jgi:hypothetical protein
MAFWPAGLPLLAFFGMFGAWKRYGRDPERRAITVQYSPPEDLSPAEVGTLVDHRAEMHDITATLVDLAVRGYVLIEEEQKKGLLGKLSKPDYVFHQRRPRAHWVQLQPHEKRYLEGLFPHRLAGKRTGAGGPPGEAGTEEPMASVRLSELTNRFYTHLDGIRSGIYDQLKAKGAYTARPDHAQAKWGVLGVGGLVGGALAAAMAAGADRAFAPHPVAVGLGMGLSGVIVLLFSGKMGVRTAAGVRMLEHALGFKEFVERVETPQFKRMITSPELFEKYLPYAMALKAEDRWAGAFEELYRQPPDWYQGSSTRGFRTTTFTRQMRSMSTEAGRSMSSSPSSSGSGSGGGGSSGGGSGGGGGRGF